MDEKQVIYFIWPKLQLLSEKTRTAVPPRWQQQGQLPHGNKVSSVDAHICVATSPLTLEVTRHMDQPFEWPHR